MRAAMPALSALRKNYPGKARNADLVRSVGAFRILADASPQPILIANEDIEIEYVNAAWEDQFGYSLDEVKGENPRILQSGRTLRDVYTRMWAALGSEKIFQSDEIIDKKKDGTLFNLLTTVIPLKRNNRLYYVQILDDITEKKRVEEVRKKFLRTAAHV